MRFLLPFFEETEPGAFLRWGKPTHHQNQKKRGEQKMEATPQTMNGWNPRIRGPPGRPKFVIFQNLHFRVRALNLRGCNSPKCSERKQGPWSWTCQRFWLVGGFNPFETYARQNGKSSPGRDENEKYLKPPPSFEEWVPWGGHPGSPLSCGIFFRWSYAFCWRLYVAGPYCSPASHRNKQHNKKQRKSIKSNQIKSNQSIKPTTYTYTQAQIKAQSTWPVVLVGQNGLHHLSSAAHWIIAHAC